MKFQLFFIFTFITNSLFGQRLHLKAFPIDTILIISHTNGYRGNGTTKGKIASFEIVFDKHENQYVVNKYIEKSFKATSRPDTVKYWPVDKLNKKTIEIQANSLD